MALKTFVAAKIHGLRLTAKSLLYNGSASLPKSLMDRAGIAAYEQIHVVNKNNGARLITYAIEGAEGQFVLNGAAARLGEVGDECLIITYKLESEFTGAFVAFVNPADNSLDRLEPYDAPRAE